ncbi:pentatricopeptide repeat-containing protein At2g33680-like [Argentina anserina]|uniref:pentatricopeptide repeat-containing protein At2g33680-like n=1 Tax=Argentina anserina TaxID=57926 RepID=UPI002176651F|nr:pentatricopeptide repeat-containing protein At2g33680-like [Potentilla anserina]
MDTLLPSSFLPALYVPQRPFPPFHSSSTKSSSVTATSTQKPKPTSLHFSPNSTLPPSSQHNLLFNDWPQLLQFSIGSKNLTLGQAIHAFLLKSRSPSDTDAFQGNNLLNLYSKLRRLGDAQKVFDEMPLRNTITWTTLLKGYSGVGDYASLFRAAGDMFRGGERFNEHTCSVILEACGSLEERRGGEQVHGFVVKSGLQDNVFVATSLVSMYSRSDCLDNAEKVFNDMDYRDVQCLNYMILEYGRASRGGKAIGVFIDLLSSGIDPNDYTFTNSISACSGDVRVHGGRQLHGLAVKYGVICETSVGNAVITMYGRHGMIEEAERMFYALDERNLISWTAVLSMYVNNGHIDKALNVFLKVLDLGIHCDPSILCPVLDACSECRNLELGRQIHAFVTKLGYDSGVHVGTALIDLYAKCGNVQSARLVFDGLSGKNTASINAVLAGFVESHIHVEEDAIVLFNQSRYAGISPDFITFSRLLSLSAEEATLVIGKSLHSYTIKAGLEADSTVGNAIITMYAKCGSIEEAFQMFNGMTSRNCITWNAIISAYALHGDSTRSLSLFENMKEEGFTPDGFTLLAILQACSYSGLWETGLCLFNEMEQKYGTRSVIEHFGCMVDLLGRAGKFSEAIDFINTSPFPDSAMLWRTLVNVCMLYGNLDFGILASTRLLELEADEAGSYILVSNMYARAGLFEEAAKVRTVMNDLQVNKEAGCSWIEVDNKFHYFVASDLNHPRSDEIYEKLNILKTQIKVNCHDRFDLCVIADHL